MQNVFSQIIGGNRRCLFVVLDFDAVDFSECVVATPCSEWLVDERKCEAQRSATATFKNITEIKANT